MKNELALVFLSPHIPSLPSVSVTLASGRTVIQPLGGDEVRECHDVLTNETRDVLRRSLVLLKSCGLRFVGPPVVERKREVEAELRAQAAKYTRLQDLVIAKWDAIASQVNSFYAEYGDQVRHRRSTALDVADVRSRFSLSWSWLPLDLPSSLSEQLFSKEEQDAIRRQLEEEARESVSRKVEGYLREMVGCLDTMAAALREKRAASRKTIGRLMESYREVAAIVPCTAASEHEAERVMQFGRLIADMASVREDCDSKKSRPQALGALAAAVETARREVEPLLDAWAVEIEAAEVEQAVGAREIGALLGLKSEPVVELVTA